MRSPVLDAADTTTKTADKVCAWEWEDCGHEEERRSEQTRQEPRGKNHTWDQPGVGASVGRAPAIHTSCIRSFTSLSLFPFC